VHVHAQYRAVTSVYYNTLYNTTIHLCQFLNGSLTNPLMVALIEAAPAFPREKIHPCPYFGYCEIYNFTLVQTSIMFQFLQGQYIMDIRLFDEIDDNIGSAVLKTEYIYG
jgi:hypothetical protein